VCYFTYLFIVWLFVCGRVIIATRHGLDGSGIESRWRRDFPHTYRRNWCPPILIYDGYRVSFSGVKWPGCGLNHPPSFTAEVKKKYSLSGPSLPVLGRTLSLPYLFITFCGAASQVAPRPPNCWKFKITEIYPVGLLWTSDQLVAGNATYTTQHPRPQRDSNPRS
jgi:hypothetical protein